MNRKNKKRPERVLTPEMLKSYKPKKNRIVEVNPKDSEKAFQFFIGKRSQPRCEKECVMPKNKNSPERVLTPDMSKKLKVTRKVIHTVNPKNSEKAFQFFVQTSTKDESTK
jgi:UDP-N-acetyl-D-mannosaminuronate dehydrogenase